MKLKLENRMKKFRKSTKQEVIRNSLMPTVDDESCECHAEIHYLEHAEELETDSHAIFFDPFSKDLFCYKCFASYSSMIDNELDPAIAA